MTTKRPEKPRRDPKVLVFGGGRSARLEVEELPRTNEGRELAIGRKFLGALKQFCARELVDLRRGSNPPDLTCQSIDGSKLSIEAVEVVDQNLRLLTRMRASYSDAIRADAALTQRFVGCDVDLVDVGDPPYLPELATPAGLRCLESIKGQLSAVGESISLPRFESRRFGDITTSAPTRKVAVIISKTDVGANARSACIRWTGGGPGRFTGEAQGHLLKEVLKKVSKRYVGDGNKLLLLAYSIDYSLDAEYAEVHATRAALAKSAHPFAECWFFFPYAGEEAGDLLQFWPTIRSWPIDERKTTRGEIPR